MTCLENLKIFGIIDFFGIAYYQLDMDLYFYYIIDIIGSLEICHSIQNVKFVKRSVVMDQALLMLDVAGARELCTIRSLPQILSPNCKQTAVFFLKCKQSAVILFPNSKPTFCEKNINKYCQKCK